MKYIAQINDQTFEFEINNEGEIIADGDLMEIDFRSVAGQSVYSMIVNGRSFEALVQITDEGLEVLLQGRLYIVNVEDERQIRLRQASGYDAAKSGEFNLKSPMPGLIISVNTREGQKVEAGDQLIVLESMKMQNELKSPSSGTVRNIRIKAGDNVEQNQVLLTIA
jgi:biotin carboxyl carrier protein